MIELRGVGQQRGSAKPSSLKFIRDSRVPARRWVEPIWVRMSTSPRARLTASRKVQTKTQSGARMKSSTSHSTRSLKLGGSLEWTLGQASQRRGKSQDPVFCALSQRPDGLCPYMSLERVSVIRPGGSDLRLLINPQPLNRLTCASSRHDGEASTHLL